MEGDGLLKKVTLNDGHKMPMFGLGVFTFLVKGESLPAAKCALRTGYRMIDTAAYYEGVVALPSRNEDEVGQAIAESGVKREEIFVVTKLMDNAHGYDECLKAFHESLKRLGLSYVDLYLIHCPSPGKNVDSYRAMMKLKEQGLIRSVGVSNFGVNHLQEMEKAGLPTPAVNQIELNPYWRLEEVVNYCKEKGIAPMGYCPIFRGRKNDDPTLVKMAKRYNKSVPQLLIRWSVQKNYITIPKSSKPERIQENADVFDFSISDDDMKTLDALPSEQCCTVLRDITNCPWRG